MNNFSDVLRDKTSLSEEKIAMLSQFNDILYGKNKVLNLTRVKEEESVYRNFMDSLNDIALSNIRGAKKVLDIGSGSGFPVIALAVVFDDIEFTAIDSTGKKTDFLKSALQQLGISNVEVICARAEELAHDNDHRERYDAVTARAVAELSVLSELACGFVKNGGKLVFYKGRNAKEELAKAKPLINSLKLRNPIIQEYAIENEKDEMHMVIFDKFERLSHEYPRHYSKIMKSKNSEA